MRNECLKCQRIQLRSRMAASIFGAVFVMLLLIKGLKSGIGGPGDVAAHLVGLLIVGGLVLYSIYCQRQLSPKPEIAEGPPQ